MSALRVSVEWRFSKIEIGTLYSITMILTNYHMCLYGSQQSAYFDIEPSHLEQYLGN